MHHDFTFHETKAEKVPALITADDTLHMESESEMGPLEMKFNDSGALPTAKTQKTNHRAIKKAVAGGMRGLILSAVTRKDQY